MSLADPEGPTLTEKPQTSRVQSRRLAKRARFSTQVRRGFLQRGVSPCIGGDSPPVTCPRAKPTGVPRRNEDASKLKDLRRRIRLVITRTQNNKLVESVNGAEKLGHCGGGIVAHLSSV